MFLLTGPTLTNSAIDGYQGKGIMPPDPARAGWADEAPIAVTRGAMDTFTISLVFTRELPLHIGASDPSKLARFPPREGGLLGLPLHPSNKGLPRPRVARAQEINRPASPSF